MFHSFCWNFLFMEFSMFITCTGIFILNDCLILFIHNRPVIVEPLMIS